MEPLLPRSCVTVVGATAVTGPAWVKPKKRPCSYPLDLSGYQISVFLKTYTQYGAT